MEATGTMQNETKVILLSRPQPKAKSSPVSTSVGVRLAVAQSLVAQKKPLNATGMRITSNINKSSPRPVALKLALPSLK